MNKIKMQKIKRRVFEVIQLGHRKDAVSTFFDFFLIITICLNLFVTIFETFDEALPYMSLLKAIEFITIFIFTIEYILRLWTADMLYPEKKRHRAVLTFAFSFFGIIDLLTIIPYILPFVFPNGAVAFRIFRVIRILRLFQINSQYDAFNVIINVLNEKKSQIFSSVVIILILMLSSSLCMYSLEHEAQPEQFENAFSGIWWSMSTMLTIGYGDIYPITPLGKLMAIVIAFLGVGLVAIPTGIISAGFVEQYARLKTLAYHSEEHDVKFVTSTIYDKHPWNQQMVKSIVFPPQLLLIMVKRKKEIIVPKGDFVLKSGDTLVLGAKNFKEQDDLYLREITIKEKNPWLGKQIMELDISRQELIVMIRRKNKVIIPNGSTFIMKGDCLLMYSPKAFEVRDWLEDEYQEDMD